MQVRFLSELQMAGREGEVRTQAKLEQNRTGLCGVKIPLPCWDVVKPWLSPLHAPHLSPRTKGHLL